MSDCGFCKGRPVGNAATWSDGKTYPPCACPRCGVVHYDNGDQAGPFRPGFGLKGRTMRCDGCWTTFTAPEVTACWEWTRQHRCPRPDVEADDDPVCEFCNGERPTMACPARDVSSVLDVGGAGPVSVGTVGAWLACEPCAALVAAGQREQLLDRAMHSVLGMSVDLPSGANRGRINDKVRVAVRQLHDDFWKSREGQPVPLEQTNEEEQADGQ